MHSHPPRPARCRSAGTGTVAAARATFCWSAAAAKEIAGHINGLGLSGLTVTSERREDEDGWLVRVGGRMQLEAAQAVRAAVLASGQEAVAFHQHRAGVTGGATPHHSLVLPKLAGPCLCHALSPTATLPVAATTSQGSSPQPGLRCAGLPPAQIV